MESVPHQIRLTGAARRSALVLMWAAAVATAFHIGGAILIDPAEFLTRGHWGVTGIGVTLDGVDPLLQSAALVHLLGYIDYLFPVIVYLGVIVFAHALSDGLPFTVRVLRGARLFAGAVLALAVQEVIFNLLASLVRMPDDAARFLSLIISTPQMVSLFLGATLVVLAAIFAKAKIVADDSASII